MERTRQLIDAAFETWWNALTPSPPFAVEYHNQAFKVPDSGTYGRMSIQFGGVGPGAIGSVMDRFEGMLCLQIFLPEDGAFSLVTQTADTVRDFWRYKQILDTTDNVTTHLDFGNVEVTPAAARNGYKQFNVWVNFRCDKYFPA